MAPLTRTIEQNVVRHYTHGSLEQAILSGLTGLAPPIDSNALEQLAAVDEFHIGGRQATDELATQLELRPRLRVLDIGCGIGGTARWLALRYQCRVTGVDVTPEYVDVGNSLNRRLGMAGSVTLRTANALALPFEHESFDRATLLHVGMNIPDKGELFSEVFTVLKPHGLVGVYDLMRIGQGELRYPVPWARTAETSFVSDLHEYRAVLSAAAFDLVAERDRREFALVFLERLQMRAAAQGVPPLGVHILMGPDAGTKIANMAHNIECGYIAPVEMVARRRPA